MITELFLSNDAMSALESDDEFGFSLNDTQLFEMAIGSNAVDSFVISAGERYDFVLAATQPVDTYWIRFHGLMDCNVNEVFQAAILHYEGAPDAEPTRVLTYNNTMRPGKVKNENSRPSSHVKGSTKR